MPRLSRKAELRNRCLHQLINGMLLQRVDTDEASQPAVKMCGRKLAGRDTIVVDALVIAALLRIASGSFAPADSTPS